jgi:transitional endoplasmic reticulum ATPase
MQVTERKDDRPEVRLQVAGAVSTDVGSNVARLPAGALEKLGLSGGEVVEVQGKRLTAAIALRARDEDVGVEIVRLDGLQRANAQVGMGEQVAVRKAESRPAQRVVVGPAHERVRLHGSGEALRGTLANRPLVAGDVVSTSVYRTPPGNEMGSPEDLFRALLQQQAYGLQEVRLVVVSTVPTGIVVVTDTTEIELRPEYTEPVESKPPDVTYDDVGGLGGVIRQLREMIELPLRHPEIFERLGIDPPRGVLLHGPPGTGKTLLARAVANETSANFLVINGPEIVGKFHGESEERLRTLFADAQARAPSILFIDELDSIAPKRSETPGEVERRLVAQLLTLMDGLAPRQNVVVIGATNRPESVDEALRRPGRFDRELVVGVPDAAGRLQILHIHTRGMPLTNEVDLQELARVTHGFVGADLSSLAREAALEALRRKLADLKLSNDKPVSPEVLSGIYVEPGDFENALKRVQPSAMREIMIQAPNVRWEDVGGLDDAKEALREGIELPLRDAEAFRRLGIRPAKGFLLYGPPGTGKTLLAKAVAAEAEANFIAARSSDLLSKWYGESEQQVARLFQRARQVAPTVVFLDEIESLTPQRGSVYGEPAVTERVVNTLLAEMDGLEELQGVVVIGATNQPDLIDTALLRPGRFDELVYVGVPDQAGRRLILGIHTRKMPLGEDVDLDDLAARTDGRTGADLEDLCRRAGLLALREDPKVQKVTRAHFERALSQTRASVTPEMEQDYRKLAERLKQEHPRDRGRMGFR